MGGSSGKPEDDGVTQVAGVPVGYSPLIAIRVSFHSQPTSSSVAR